MDGQKPLARLKEFVLRLVVDKELRSEVSESLLGIAQCSPNERWSPVELKLFTSVDVECLIKLDVMCQSRNLFSLVLNCVHSQIIEHTQCNLFFKDEKGRL